MNSLNSTLKRIVNLQEWQQAQDDFKDATKLSLKIIDCNGNFIAPTDNHQFFCQIVSSKNNKQCNKGCLKELVRIKENKLKYSIFKCGCGLSNIMLPINLKNDIIGAIIYGPIRNIKEDIILYEKIAKDNNVNSEELYDAGKNIPSLKPEIIETYLKLGYTLQKNISKLIYQRYEGNNKLKELEVVQRINKMINSTLDLEKILKYIIKAMKDNIGASNSSILIFGTNPKRYTLDGSGIPKQYLMLEDGIAQEIRKSDKIIKIPNIKTDPRFSSNSNFNCYDSLISIPLKAHEELKGILTLYFLNTNNMDLNFISIVANQIGLAIQNAKQFEQLKELAVTDKLTNLYNRRKFMGILKNETSRSSRSKSPLSVALLDIDYFKHYNDTNGHLMGDKLLEELSKILSENVRTIDTCGRYGGEEFVIILPNAKPDEATSVAERVRSAIEKHKFDMEEKQPNNKMTISMGVVTCMNGSLGSNEMIKEADLALYKAKNNGRNRVVSTIIVDKNINPIHVQDVKNTYGKT